MTEEESIMRLLDKIKDHILLMDGAMGTYYNQQYGTELEAEEANLGGDYCNT